MAPWTEPESWRHLSHAEDGIKHDPTPRRLRAQEHPHPEPGQRIWKTRDLLLEPAGLAGAVVRHDLPGVPVERHAPADQGRHRLGSQPAAPDGGPDPLARQVAGEHGRITDQA